jgi:hypothetical protein
MKARRASTHKIYTNWFIDTDGTSRAYQSHKLWLPDDITADEIENLCGEIKSSLLDYIAARDELEEDEDS